MGREFSNCNLDAGSSDEKRAGENGERREDGRRQFDVFMVTSP